MLTTQSLVFGLVPNIYSAFSFLIIKKQRIWHLSFLVCFHELPLGQLPLGPWCPLVLSPPCWGQGLDMWINSVKSREEEPDQLEYPLPQPWDRRMHLFFQFTKHTILGCFPPLPLESSLSHIFPLWKILTSFIQKYLKATLARRR